MNVAILLFDGVITSSYTGPYDIFIKGNDIYKSFFPRYQKNKFDVNLIDFSPSQAFINQPLAVTSYKEAEKHYDLVIIPSMDFDRIESIIQQENLITFLKKQLANSNTEVASICTGTFLLAKTGILNGRRATTHWAGFELFRGFYPNVELLDDKVITDDRGIYTCGGAFTFAPFILYLIEKYCGRETSVALSKFMLIDLYKDPQSTYNIFSLQHTHNDKPIQKVQQELEAQYKSNVSIDGLANDIGMSRRTLLRRFKSATGNTPSEYLQRVRIEAAKRYLESDQIPIDHIPSMIGYEDYGFFLKLFKKHVGVSPKAYRHKFSKEHIEALSA